MSGSLSSRWGIEVYSQKGCSWEEASLECWLPFLRKKQRKIITKQIPKVACTRTSKTSEKRNIARLLYFFRYLSLQDMTPSTVRCLCHKMENQCIELDSNTQTPLKKTSETNCAEVILHLNLLGLGQIMCGVLHNTVIICLWFVGRFLPEYY